MADDKQHVLVRKKSFVLLQKLKAGVCLLAFGVMLVSGLRADVPLTTIMLRTTMAILAVVLVSRVVIQILITYEEMNGGKG